MLLKEILPISGTLVTVCNPGLLNGDFSSDVFDLLQRSSGMPKIFLKIKYLFSKNEKYKWYFVTKIVLTYCEKELF